MSIRTLVTALALTAGALLPACGPRVHLREDQGVATRAWAARQRVNQEAATGKPAGLDSEEAAIIHGRYRETLGGCPKDVGPAQVLLLQDDGGGRVATRSTKK